MTITATILADSISQVGIRLTTMQLRYPRFIHAEFMTHRVFSRNASSSRAIPVERLIRDVIDDPVYPSFWGKNQPGMQAREECNERVTDFLLDHSYDSVQDTWGTGSRELAWDEARRSAIRVAQAFTKAGYHKQIVNRLLEPFSHINVVCSATEWNNFFELRCHPDAQPEMRLLAEAMREALKYSKPNMVKLGSWTHLPYITADGWTLFDAGLVTEDDLRKVSVARCARVSYRTQDGKTANVEDDLKLYDRLVGSVPLHASPAEHQATPDEWLEPCSMWDPSYRGWLRPKLHGNFRGWIQNRKLIETNIKNAKSE